MVIEVGFFEHIYEDYLDDVYEIARVLAEGLDSDKV